MKKIRCRVLALLLATLVCMNGMPLEALAAGSASNVNVEIEDTVSGNDVTDVQDLDYVLGRPMTEEEIQEQREITQEALKHNGYIASERDYDQLILDNEINIYRGVLPSSYDSRNVNGVSRVSSVKNQNPYGSCWSFAAMACAESDMISKGYSDDSIDLSESHLIFFAHHSAPDVLGNDYEDSISYGGTTSYLDYGGNEDLAYGALASWKGAVSETYAPYENVTNGLEQTTEVAYMQDVAHLQGCYFIHKDDVDAIKTAIMEHGAVGASYYESDSYRNYETAAYYCNTETNGNHAITIVGWDDTYSKANFRTQPSADGAWLIKNSWGSSWGLSGYFWMSYEDATLNGFYAFDMETADNYDNKYQYDFCSTVVSGAYSGTQAANVYEVKGNPGKLEQLQAVAIDLTTETNVNYSIQIYRNLTDMSDPTSGTPMLSEPQTGATTFAGYYTIPLKENVTLSQGDNFSVVFTFDKITKIDVEYAYNQIFINNSSSQANESYVYFSGWVDIGARGEGNLRIKAFTQNLDDAIVNCTGVSIAEETASVMVGETKTLTAVVMPAEASNNGVAWESSNPYIASVDASGTVTGVSRGTATITVRTFDGDYTASCEVTVDAVDATGVTLNITEADLKVGQTLMLEATVSPEDATYKNVYWFSSDEDVAEVDDNGKVTALSGGTAVITAMEENGVYYAHCVVNVIVPVTRVQLLTGTGEIELNVGDTYSFAPYVKITPENATNQNVTWSSSDTDVASIDDEGLVTAVGPGLCTITVTTEDGSYQATCGIYVNTIPVTSIELDQTEVTLKTGQEVQLNAKVLPENATNQEVLWSSSNPAAISVDSTGLVTAIKPATATIRAMVQKEDGSYLSATCEVESIMPASGVGLSWELLPMNKGEEFTLSAYVSPAGASNKNVIWTSSNEAVATVDSDGKIVAVGGGTTTITVTTVDGGFQASCTVEVYAPVTSVDFEYGEYRIDSWGYTLPVQSVTVLPEDATDKVLDWYSSDTSVISVDSQGTLTFHQSGGAWITATASNGVSKTILVDSVMPVRGISLNQSQVTLQTFERLQLEATVNPADATNRYVKWSSSDEQVASVDSAGNVFAEKVGEAVITATTDDGGYQATCKIKVIESDEDENQPSVVRYTITYNLNGGTNNSSNPGSYTCETSTITLKNPTRTGYTFGGWYSDKACTKKVTSIAKGSTGNKTLYAKWTVAKYTITYNLNGGKNSSSNPASYTVATSTITLKNPTRTGYTFGGWYSDKACTKKVTSIAKGSTGNKTLYAKWTATKYTITYNLNGGKNNSSNPKSYTVATDTIKFKNPTKTGYTFKGWYSDKACTKKVTSIAKGSTGNKTLYAKWTANKYTIKFNANGGKGTMSAMKDRQYGKSYTLKKNAFTRKGYTFVGWNTKKDGSGKSYDDKDAVKNLIATNGKTVTLYAQWKKETYTIKYNLNGGTNNKSNPKTYTVETDTIKLKKPTKKGYTFEGWYSDKKCTKKVTQIKKGSTGNVKLYAKWIKK